MKFINKFLIGVAATSMLASCSSDFLETKPTSSTATATVFESTDNVKLAINGIAMLMKTQYGAFSQGFCGERQVRWLYENYPSQSFNYNYYAPGWEPIYDGKYYTRVSSTYCAYPWTYYYEIIADANSIIANVDGANGAEVEKKFYKAQALTFRAYAYSQLVKYYCLSWKDSKNGTENTTETGLVLRLDESTGDMPKSTPAEVYAQIYADCDDAIKLFDESGIDRAAAEFYLTNANVAHAIKARAALNREDYSTALSEAKLARTGYPLMSNADYTSGFCYQTSEWLFGSYGSADENTWYWSFGTQGACNGYYAGKYNYGTGAIDKTLYKQIPNDDIRKKCFLTEDKFPGFDFSSAANVNQTYGYFVGDDLWDAADAYIASRTPKGLDRAYKSGYFYDGAQLKFWCFDSPGVMNECFIRSSEMVLIEAEANYFLGKPADAQASLIELNKNTGRDAAYDCTKTGTELLKEIKNYRALELWGEGFDWFDHKRWGDPIERVSIANGGNCHASVCAKTIECNAASNYWTWSIPEIETLYNMGLNPQKTEME